MENLTQALWRERDVLEVLLYKLQVEEMILAAGRTRWLGQAAREIGQVITALREVSLLRATAVAEACAELGLDAESSLKEIAEAADDPWKTILFEHREALVNISSEVTAASSNNRELLAAGYQGVRDTLALLAETSEVGYTADGTADAAPAPSRLLDRSL